MIILFFFASRRRHTRWPRDWSSDVCSSDLGEGYFSPDGQKLIFQSEREPGNPFYQMYLLDLRSGDTTRVSPGTGKTTCGFFQPGTDRVIFASTHGDKESAAKQKA